MNGKCAKVTVTAILINKDKLFIGQNWCLNPQKSCPREFMPSGVGYEKCKDICGQGHHAEVNACILAGKHAEGATLYLHGHTYACEPCKAFMKKCKVKKLVIL